MKILYRALIFMLLLSATLFAQKDLGDGWKIHGLVGIRSELDGRDFSNSTHPLTFTSSKI